MTVSSTSSRVVYQGNGSATAFSFAFQVNQAADLTVTYTDTTGTDYPLSPSLYSVTGLGSANGGTVTYPLSGSPIASNTYLTIQRLVSPTQPTQISNQGAMWPQVIEAAMDRIVMICQGFLDVASRALVISPTDGNALNPLPNETLRANSYLGFDGNGQPIALAAVSGITGVTTWIYNNLLTVATSTSTACAAIGAALLSGNNAFTGTNTAPTQNAGDNSTKLATTAYADRSSANAVATYVIRSYLAGLGLSNDAGTPNTKIDVAAGACADSTNVAMLAVLAGVIDCTTVGANGLDAGTLAASTWYHAYAIGQAGGASPALLASTSASAPTMPSGYTLKRRIGSFKTDGSAHILAFLQEGDYFRWLASVLDVNTTNPGTAAILAGLTVPPGLHVQWFGNAMLTLSSTPGSLYVSDPAANDEVPVAQGASYAAPGLSVGNRTGTSISGSQIQVRTNTSGQIRYRVISSGADTVVGIATLGWIDRRGRDL